MDLSRPSYEIVTFIWECPQKFASYYILYKLSRFPRQWVPDMGSKDHIVHDILPDETADILHPLHGSLI